MRKGFMSPRPFSRWIAQVSDKRAMSVTDALAARLLQLVTFVDPDCLAQWFIAELEEEKMASGSGRAAIARILLAVAMLVAALCMSGCDEDAGPDADPAPWTSSVDLRPGQ
jgi:hypothetical protein